MAARPVSAGLLPWMKANNGKSPARVEKRLMKKEPRMSLVPRKLARRVRKVGRRMEKVQVVTLRLQPGAAVPSSPPRLAAQAIKSLYLEVKTKEVKACAPPLSFVKSPDFSYRLEHPTFRSAKTPHLTKSEIEARCCRNQRGNQPRKIPFTSSGFYTGAPTGELNEAQESLRGWQDEKNLTPCFFDLIAMATRGKFTFDVNALDCPR